MKRKKLRNLGMTIASALASAMAMYVLAPYWAVIVAMAVLIAHEFGHWLIAKAHHGDPSLPVFIPFVLGAIGVTRVKGIRSLSTRDQRYLFWAGPMAGGAAAMALAPIALVLRSWPYALAIFIAIAWEIYSGTCGSDGKRASMKGTK